MNSRCLVVFRNILDVPRNNVLFPPGATMHILNRTSAQTVSRTSQLGELRSENLSMVSFHIILELLDITLANSLHTDPCGRIFVDIPASGLVDLIWVKCALRTYRGVHYSYSTLAPPEDRSIFIRFPTKMRRNRWHMQDA